MARALIARARTRRTRCERSPRISAATIAGDASAAGPTARGGPQARRTACCEGSSAEARQPDLWFTYHLYHKAPDWLGPAGHRAARHSLCGRRGVVRAEAGGRTMGLSGTARWPRRSDAPALILQPNPADAECVLPLLDDPERLIAAPAIPRHGAVSRAGPRGRAAPRSARCRPRPSDAVAADRRDDARRPEAPLLSHVSPTRCPGSRRAAGSWSSRAPARPRSKVRAAFARVWRARPLGQACSRRDTLKQLYRARRPLSSGRR